MDDVTDIKRIGVSRLTLGLIMSVASISGVVVWKAASVANQISDLEAKVAVIEQNTGTDSSVLAKLEEISDGVQENENGIANLHAARLDDLDRFAPSLIVEAIAADMNTIIKEVDDMKQIVAGLSWIPTEFTMVHERIDDLEDD
jgi:hypothetical protein|tara:strand:+ start:2028 stop:2459 length:432 start_codon:yes stop_codon:yes gene_type:complete